MSLYEEYLNSVREAKISPFTNNKNVLQGLSRLYEQGLQNRGVLGAARIGAGSDISRSLIGADTEKETTKLKARTGLEQTGMETASRERVATAENSLRKYLQGRQLSTEKELAKIGLRGDFIKALLGEQGALARTKLSTGASKDVAQIQSSAERYAVRAKENISSADRAFERRKLKSMEDLYKQLTIPQQPYEYTPEGITGIATPSLRPPGANTMDFLLNLQNQKKDNSPANLLKSLY